MFDAGIHNADTDQRQPHRAARLLAVVRQGRRGTPLRAARDRPERGTGHTPGAARRHRDTTAAGRELRAERHHARHRETADHHHHRPQHGRKVGPAAPDRAHSTDGTDGLFRAGREREDWLGGQDFHTSGGIGQHLARRIDIRSCCSTSSGAAHRHTTA